MDLNNSVECSPLEYNIRNDVERFRKAGLNDVIIAHFIASVRAWAITDERRRVEKLNRDNYTNAYTHPNDIQALFPKDGE